MRLQDKVVLVTGAAGGIGHAVTDLFAREGAQVFAADIQAPKTPYAKGVEALTLDVTSEGDWDAAVDAVIEKTGRLDVLVNNAGIIAYEPLHELGIEAWNRMIAIDQTGVFLGMREAVRVMRKQKSGSIVNISSIWGTVAVAYSAGYHATKAAVRQLTKHAAVAYAPENIRVNSVHPGIIATPLTLNGHTDDSRAGVIAATPLGRMGLPIEAANSILFLASDEASFVTGAELAVDGGYLAQ